MQANQPYYAPYLPSSVSYGVDVLLGRTWLERKLAALVNDAINDDPKVLADLRAKLLQDRSHEPVSLPTPDGAQLDGVLMRAQPGKTGKGVIFYVLGRSGTYEKCAKDDDCAKSFIEFFKNDVSHGDVDIFVINNRSIGESKGSPSFVGWEQDIHTTLQHLMKSYKPQHIMLYGHSLGSWISRGAIRALNLTLAANKIKQVSDRSMACMPMVAYDQMGRGMKGNAAYYALTAAKWNASSLSTGAEQDPTFVIYSREDTTVTYSVSLHAALTAKGHFTSKKARDHSYEMAMIDGCIHARPFTPQERAHLGPALRKFMQLK